MARQPDAFHAQRFGDEQVGGAVLNHDAARCRDTQVAQQTEVAGALWLGFEVRAFDRIGRCKRLRNADSAQNGPGVTDKEIKIGNTMPYSGPASGYSSQGRATTAYFNMINAKGGINGRKINLLSYDDGYSPPKTVEQTRKLVEQDEVAFIFSTIGTAHNTATAKYLSSARA